MQKRLLLFEKWKNTQTILDDWNFSSFILWWHISERKDDGIVLYMDHLKHLNYDMKVSFCDLLDKDPFVMNAGDVDAKLQESFIKRWSDTEAKASFKWEKYYFWINTAVSIWFKNDLPGF